MEWRILWSGCVYIWLLSIKLDSGSMRKSVGRRDRGNFLEFLVRWRLLPGTHEVLLGERSLWRGGFEEMRMCGDYEDR